MTSLNNVKGVSAENAHEVSAYYRFCATTWLNIGVRVRLTEVSAEGSFILQ